MKRIKLLLAVLLAPLAFQAVADDMSDIARATTRRDISTVPSSTRQKTTSSAKGAASVAPSRTTGTTKQTPTPRERTTGATSAPARNVTRTANDTNTKNISARTAYTVQPRAIKTPSRTTQTRTPASLSRVATSRDTAKSHTPSASLSRGRTATTTTGNEILGRDFSKCRTVFYDCMDEFCANKDSQLKRCACSSRIHEFDGVKKNLANVEEKLQAFSQRLLTVNMDREDAAALYTPTAGELAYSDADKSESKKMLDEIAKKLNTSFNDNNFDQSLNAISLSLNTDAAFDSIDSMAGAATTTKSGTELYASALPTCREMAAEVCTPSDLAIAESGYQMVIETDCSTVKKSFQTQTDQARAKVFESGALLDMSRLDIHQKRNSDDILTCKQKMLDMLTDSTVCGDSMGKCLDTTGRYIDPTTGTAFLTTELSNLSSLITRPESGQTWRTAPGNERFVTFLNSKKKFLEPAMENCQDISEYVWDEFIENALPQIKLAQDAKLEEMRQSCTTLTTQCLDDTYDSITKFDARALSIFGVAVDQTVNAMCSDIRNACTALMETSGGAENWQTGMTEIATEKTYETILQTCREVGRACIIQACTSVSGNFGLCENIDTSINRKSIINRKSCWDDVVKCVASAGPDALTKIQASHALDTIAQSQTPDTTATAETSSPNIFRTFYGDMYGIDRINQITLNPNDTSTNACISGEGTNCVHDICQTECENSPQDSPVSTECYTCRLAERIWGNCEAPSNTELTNRTATSDTDDDNNAVIAYHNKIKTTDANGRAVDTLLAWFAKNTGTADETDSCRDTSCRPGYVFAKNGFCSSPGDLDSTGTACNNGQKINVYNGLTNCCATISRDEYGNCCHDGKTSITSKNELYFGGGDIIGKELCTNSNTANLVAQYTNNGQSYNLVCMGNISWTGESDGQYPNGKIVRCSGKLLLIDANGHYRIPTSDNAISQSYETLENTTCIYDHAENKWSNTDNQSTECPAAENWTVTYTTNNTP